MSGGSDRRAIEDELFARLLDPDTDEASRRRIRDELVQMHLPLVRHIARRYADRGEPVDDVVQVGTVGLIQAVDRYRPEQGTAFSSFAVPTILGAIRRHFRDATWSVKVPRRVRELRGRIDAAHDELVQTLGRSPTVAEIAERAGVEVDDVLDSLELSRVRELTPLDGRTEDEEPLIERLGDIDAALNEVEDKQTVERLLATLPDRERTIMTMRFYQGRSQSQIAEALGMSQMHVSRLLARSLAHLRSEVYG